MLWKKTIIALVVFAVSLIAVFASGITGGGQGPEFVRPAIDPETINHLTVTGSDKAVDLEKTEDGWVVLPEGYPADSKAVETALKKAAEVEVGSMLSSNPGLQEELGVHDGGFHVELLRDGAAVFSFFLGKEKGDNRGHFIRKAGEERVYATSSKIKSAFEKELKFWRNRKFLDEDREMVNHLTIEKDGEVLSFTKKSGTWEVDLPVDELPADFRLDRSSVEGIATTMASLMANDFEDGEKDLGKLGFMPPKMKVTATLSGKDQPLVLLIGDQKEKKYFAKRPEAPWVYLVQDFYVKKLNKGLEDFRDLTVSGFDAKQARQIRIESEAGTLVFDYDETRNDWRISESSNEIAGDFRLDPEKVRMMVASVARFKAGRYLGKGNPAKFGLTTTESVVTVTLEDGGQKHIRIGNFIGEEDVYVTGDDGIVYTVAKRSADRLTSGLEYYKVEAARQQAPMFTPEMLQKLPPEVQQQFLQKQRQEIMQRQMMKQFQRQQEKQPAPGAQQNK